MCLQLKSEHVIQISTAVVGRKGKWETKRNEKKKQ